jgi:hypothetical protein
MFTLIRYYRRTVWIFVHEPAFRALGLATLVVLLSGCVFYHYVEDWSWLDSLYFCTITLATIGYGDLVPTTDLGRAFTILYALLGLGIVATFVTSIVKAPLLMSTGMSEPGPLADSRLDLNAVVAPKQAASTSDQTSSGHRSRFRRRRRTRPARSQAAR